MRASINRRSDQGSLFETPGKLPDGMRYAADLISPDEEQALVVEMAHLPFRAFEFHGFLGRRRTVSFGWSNRLHTAVETMVFKGDREKIRTQAAAHALRGVLALLDERER